MTVAHDSSSSSTNSSSMTAEAAHLEEGDDGGALGQRVWRRKRRQRQRQAHAGRAEQAVQPARARLHAGVRQQGPGAAGAGVPEGAACRARLRQQAAPAGMAQRGPAMRHLARPCQILARIKQIGLV